MKRHITFTPLVKSVHGVFSPQLNTYIKFVQLLAAGLSEKFVVTYVIRQNKRKSEYR